MFGFEGGDFDPELDSPRNGLLICGSRCPKRVSSAWPGWDGWAFLLSGALC
jgi:hypothetical protein